MVHNKCLRGYDIIQRYDGQEIHRSSVGSCYEFCSKIVCLRFHDTNLTFLPDYFISFVPRSGKLLPIKEQYCSLMYDVLVSCQKIFIYSKVRYRLVSLMFDVGCLVGFLSWVVGAGVLSAWC